MNICRVELAQPNGLGILFDNTVDVVHIFGMIKLAVWVEAVCKDFYPLICHNFNCFGKRIDILIEILIFRVQIISPVVLET